MSDESWPRVKEILNRVLAAAPEDREAAIARECGGDEALRAEVESFLKYENSAPALLSPTVWREEASEPERVPERIGCYQVVRELGRGGMGTVYLAERDDGEYRQEVAIKVVSTGVDAVLLSELFRHERQILARLNHPNIAHLMDGGTTGDGRPFFVMEYVAGSALTLWLKRSALDVRARLRMFMRICDAVGHAHRMLLIHGDLKPANVLVDANGTPKLLDFGIARMRDESLPVEFAESRRSPLTPQYASPEQLRGEPLTTATDIYSLGAILSEMLTGCAPGEGVAGRAVSGDRDLDSIVLRALEEDSGKRYGSVDAVQADIERYLAGYPVAARGGGAWYRARRFIGRNRWGVTAAAAALVGIAAAFIVIWRVGREAQMRFDQLRQFARAVVFEVYGEVEKLPGSTKAREMLVQRTLTYLQSLEAGSKDAALKWELAEAYARIGGAQGYPAAANLGDTGAALESYGRAQALLSELVSDSPNDQRAIRSLADVDDRIASLLETRGEREKAQAVYRDAAALLERTARLSDTLEARKALARSRWNLAYRVTNTNDWVAAADLWRQTLGAYEELAAMQPGNLNARRNVALCHKRLAAVLTQRADLPAAERHYREARKIDTERVRADGADMEAKSDLALDLSDLALVQATAGRPKEALATHAEALELRRTISASDPNDLRARASVARTLKRMGYLAGTTADVRGGIVQLTESTSILAGLCERDPANVEWRREYAIGLLQLGILHRASAQGETNAVAARGAWMSAAASLERARVELGKIEGKVNFVETEREQIATLSRELARCKAALARGGPEGRTARERLLRSGR